MYVCLRLPTVGMFVNGLWHGPSAVAWAVERKQKTNPIPYKFAHCGILYNISGIFNVRGVGFDIRGTGLYNTPLAT